MAAHAETRILGHADLQIHVAGSAAVAAGLAFAAQPDLLSVFDAGRDMRLEFPAVRGQGHGHALHRLAECQSDLRIAVLAAFGLCRLLIACAVATAVRRTGLRAGAATEHREDVVEVRLPADRSLEAHTGAARCAAAEHGTEDIGESAGVESTCTGASCEAGATHAELANRVILLAFVLIAQHVVGFGDVLELLLGFLGLVDVGVVLARQLAVGFFDFVGGGVFGDTEDLVEILVQPFILSHHCLLSRGFHELFHEAFRKVFILVQQGLPNRRR